MSARIGGAGASNLQSRPYQYYQTVPKDALEKMIWAEADKRIFINTVTEPVLQKRKKTKL
jgi:zinc protease